MELIIKMDSTRGHMMRILSTKDKQKLKSKHDPWLLRKKSMEIVLGPSFFLSLFGCPFAEW